MEKHPLPRLDQDTEMRRRLQPFCRLAPGEIWWDPEGRHAIGCLDAASVTDVALLCGDRAAVLAIHDPPYNFVAFKEQPFEQFVAWCREVVACTASVLAPDASLYLWMGADPRHGFAPLPEIVLMLREMMASTGLLSRSWITLRNQRGYGTQQNWMSVRQELLYYTRGTPPFHTQYTELPKKVGGYYKVVHGVRQENLARGRARTLRPGNVWIDLQQVFYRMEENVNGCYAQKPLRAFERIIQASSEPGDLVIDFFAHAGTTLLAAERTGRHCRTMDLDPIYAEITIRRLERYRQTGRTGWQNSNPFANELGQR